MSSIAPVLQELKEFVDSNIESLSEYQIKIGDKIVETFHKKNMDDARELLKCLKYNIETSIDIECKGIDTAFTLYNVTKYVEDWDIKTNKSVKLNASNIKDILSEIGYANSTVAGTIRKFSEGTSINDDNIIRIVLSNIEKSRSKYAKSARTYLERLV